MTFNAMGAGLLVAGLTFGLSAQAADYVEFAPFRAKVAVTEAQVLAAVDAMAPSVRNFPGFLRRETIRMEDGSWLDVVHWRDEKSARDALGLAGESKQCQAFFALIDSPETGLRYGRTVRVQLDKR